MSSNAVGSNSTRFLPAKLDSKREDLFISELCHQGEEQTKTRDVELGEKKV